MVHLREAEVEVEVEVVLEEATARASARLFGSLRLSQPVLGVALEGRWDRRKSCTMMGSTWCMHAIPSQVRVSASLSVSASQSRRSGSVSDCF